MAEVVIRDLSEEDIEGVCQVEETVFTMPWTRDSFENMLHSNEAIFLVATVDDLIVGICGMNNIVGEGHISNVAVLEEYRRRGIGTSLIANLIEAGRGIGITSYTLEVRSGNVEAIELYKSYGFKVEGIRRDFYSMPNEDGLIMWKREVNDLLS